MSHGPCRAARPESVRAQCVTAGVPSPAVDLLAFFLALGAIARVTRFVNDDVLAAGLRQAVHRRYGGGSPLFYVLGCPWCLSIYVAPPIMTAAYLVPTAWWFVIPAASLTASYAYALLAVNADPASR